MDAAIIFAPVGALMPAALQIPVRTVTQVFPLLETNTALERLRTGQLTGAAVLVPQRKMTSANTG